MLNIYTDIALIPEDKEYINDNEAFFRRVGFFNRSAVEPILNVIENGTWRDNTTFFDRFGVVLYSDFISTGAKTLINILGSDKVFNGNEMGSNALQYLLCSIDGNVLLSPMYMFEVEISIDIGNICVNGKPVESLSELEDLLCY